MKFIEGKSGNVQDSLDRFASHNRFNSMLGGAGIGILILCVLALLM